MRGEKIPADIRRKVVEMRLAGVDAAVISEQLELPSIYTIRHHWRAWAEELGIAAPEKRITGRKAPPQTGLSEAELWQKRKHAVLMRAQSIDAAQTARRTGLSEQEIRQNWREWAKTLDIAVPEPPEAPDLPCHGEIVTYFVEPQPKKPSGKFILPPPGRAGKEKTKNQNVIQEEKEMETYTAKEFPVAAAFEIIRTIFAPEDITGAEMHLSAPEFGSHIHLQAKMGGEEIELTLKVRSGKDDPNCVRQ